MSMNLEKLVAVSGTSGVFQLVATKNNGLILENIDTKKRNFYSSRTYNFTPLESLSVYVTDSVDETIELGGVFSKMQEQLETNPPVSSKADAEATKTYFAQILPDYDRDKVYLSDMKKIIKWFVFLQERNLLKPKTTEVDAEASVEIVE